jgi:thioredoxin 1
MVSPIVDEIAGENPSVKVCKVNIDEQPQLASLYGVMSIPTLMIFQNGDVVDKAVGARNKAFILQMLEG